MTASCVSRRVAIKATILGALAALFLGVTATAVAAAPAETFSNKVTFIGDSVTAGFGFCGTEDSAKVECEPNEAMENSWDDPLDGTNLRKCAPPTPLDDACSNDNYRGRPWEAPAWTPGPKAPKIAYPFQLAATQSPVAAASVSDWAVSGATPGNWDPQGGGYGGLLAKLRQQYVVMTLGANPLLSAFTDIKLDYVPVEEGVCASSTGYQPHLFGPWYAGPLTNPLGCLTKEWRRQDQTGHLVRIYTDLLAQGDRVVVLGYYRGCPWSFGNWQVEGSVIHGPAHGKDCKGETRPISPTDPTKISQWQQAGAVSGQLNALVYEAVQLAQAAAKSRWPGTGRADNIVFIRPDLAEWEGHQPSSGNSWIFLNDTWIHPSPAGHTALARTVAKGMCASFGRWCVSNGVMRWE